MNDALRECLEPLLPEGITFDDLYPRYPAGQGRPLVEVLTHDTQGTLISAPGLKDRGRSLAAGTLRRYLGKQKALKASYQKSLDRLLSKAEKSGPEDREALLASFGRLARKNFLKAHEIGVGVTARGRLSPKEPALQAFLADRVQHDTEHFQRFLQAIWTGGEKMSRSARRDLYVQGLDSFFSRGALAGTPDDVAVFWKLSPAEHCIDCLSLAANNPYTKPGIGSNPLPTVPRGLKTQCLSNCKCYLQWQDAEGVEFREKPTPGYDMRPAEGEDMPDPEDPEVQAVQEELDRLAEEMSYNKAMYALTGDEKYIEARRDANARVIELQDQLGVRIVPRMPSNVMEKAAIEAVDEGYEPILEDDASKLTAGMGAALLRLGDFNHGRLTEWDPDTGAGVFTSADGEGIPVTAGDEQPSILLVKGASQLLGRPWAIPEPPGYFVSDVPGFQASYAEAWPPTIDTTNVAALYRRTLEQTPRGITFGTQLRVMPQEPGQGPHYSLGSKGVLESKGVLAFPFVADKAARQLQAAMGALFYRDNLRTDDTRTFFDPYTDYFEGLKADLQLALDAEDDETAFGLAMELWITEAQQLADFDPDLYDMVKSMVEGYV